MHMKEPQKLPLEELYGRLPQELKHDDGLFYDNGFAIGIGINNYMFNHAVSPNQPYLLEDYRIGLVLKGHLHGIINLQEVFIPENTIVFITPGTIVQPIEVPDYFRLNGVGMPADMFHFAHANHLPEVFNGQMRAGRHTVTAEERKLIEAMFQMLMRIVRTEGMSRDVVYSMITTLTSYVSHVFTNAADPLKPPSHNTDIFNRFLRLVNLNCRAEHQIAFYASRLCISERYLGSVVRQTSGVTAKEWIDRAIIMAAKVMLRHTDKQVAMIADELHFGSQSFFCKYFRRMTGMSPQEYREAK